MIFRAESEKAGRAMMNNDPAVQKGVMRATLFPFRVALMEHREDAQARFSLSTLSAFSKFTKES